MLPALRNVSHPDADFVLMVKPQFEVGKERLGKGGVVREPALRVEAVVEVAHAADELGLGVRERVREPAAGAVRQRRVLRLVAARSRPGRPGHGAGPSSTEGPR